MAIEFYFWRECPSHERALAMLREEMREQDIDEGDLRVTEVLDDDEAALIGFPGSPTIRIDGVDLQDPGAMPGGLTCRVYRKRDGRPSPLPDAEDLREALAARKDEEHSPR